MAKTVTIYCKNNDTFNDYPLGTSLLEIYNDLGIKLKYPVLAARVNYKVESLNFLVYKPKNIEFIDVSNASGYRVYVRSMSMIMAKALNDIMPEATLRIEFPICHGYYCCIDNKNFDVPESLIDKLEVRMRELIEENATIDSIEEQTPSVIHKFKAKGQNENAVLLETLGIPYARYFRIDDFIDYYNGVLVPSTGYIKRFQLTKYKKGFILIVPERKNPVDLAVFEDQPKMFEVFSEFAKWNKVMDLSNVGDFNSHTRTSNVHNMIKISEAQHEKKIAYIADMIKERPECRFIMISGPSSSGKTTFSKRLSIQLMVEGIKPTLLSLDNYFVNREDTPLDENGEWDFEHITAIDLPLLNDQLARILDGECVEVPFFNFETGKREWRGTKIQLYEGAVLLLEGIHALNPDLTNTIPESSKFKI